MLSGCLCDIIRGSVFSVTGPFSMFDGLTPDVMLGFGPSPKYKLHVVSYASVHSVNGYPVDTCTPASSSHGCLVCVLPRVLINLSSN